MFVGRRDELGELEKSYQRAGMRLFELYGPRNAGKTALLEEFCTDKDVIFFTAEHESVRANLEAFSKLVLSHYEDRLHNKFIFWSEAFRYIADRQDGKRIVIIIDNFNEINSRDPVFIEMLRKCITTTIKDENMLIILSGQNKILDHVNERLLQKITTTLKLSKFTLTDDVVEQLTSQAAATSPESGKAKMLRVTEDEVIMREGETNAYMYKIISGKAVCYLGYGTDDEYVIGTLKDGQCFGEYSLLTDKPGVYTVAAYTDMLLMRIGRDDFSRFVEMNADNAVGIMRNMAKMINVLKVNIDMLREESAVKA